MTELTTEQRHRLAKQVLGWTLESAWVEGVESKVWSHTEPSGVLGYEHLVPDCERESWEPDNNIEQAFMLVEKIGVHIELIRYEDGRWKCLIGLSDIVGPRSSSASFAICLAVLDWIGEKKETK